MTKRKFTEKDTVVCFHTLSIVYLLAMVVGDGSNFLQLAQVFVANVVSVDHSILNGGIISTKDKDGITSRVIERA